MYWLLGWYQINQGLGYIAEHLNSNGNYEIRIKKDLNSGVNGLNVVFNHAIVIVRSMMFLSIIHQVLMIIQRSWGGYAHAYLVDVLAVAVHMWQP